MMRRAGHVAVLVALVCTTWWVYTVRASFSLAGSDSDAVAALQRRLDSIPSTIGDGRFHLDRITLSPEIVAESGAEAYAMLGVSLSSRRQALQLYVGGAVRPEVFFHPPYWCLPAAGYTISEDGPTRCDALKRGATVPRVNRLVVAQEDRELLVYFWYQTADEVSHEWWASRLFRFQDLLARRPYRPTFIVVLYADVTTTVADTEALAMDFLAAAAPLLHRVTVTRE